MNKLTEKEIVFLIANEYPARLSAQGVFNLDLEYPSENTSKIGRVTNFSIYNGKISGEINISDKTAYDFDEISDIEFLAHPITSLAKTIRFNGEDVVPILELARIAFPEYTFIIKKGGAHSYRGVSKTFFYWAENGFSAFNETAQTIDVPNQLSLFQKMAEMHIDFMGLIDRGVALPIENN